MSGGDPTFLLQLFRSEDGNIGARSTRFRKEKLLAIAGHVCFRGWGTYWRIANGLRRVNGTGVPGRLRVVKLYSTPLEIEFPAHQMRVAN
jgi:hypothetical protein